MATATSKLNIIVDVLNDPNANRTVGSIKSSLSSIAAITGSVVAAGYAAKQAWDFTKEGADLQLTAEQFRNVAENAGYFSDTLLIKMREATDGMVSDAELMRSGLQIIELGLADSESGVVDLATVVSRLGLDMQQVIMTFANDSIMRLDALGLSVEDVQNRVKELNAEGFSGDAFDQAVLEGLQKRMEVLGDTSETTAGQIKILETEFQNLKDSAKGTAAEIAGPFISKLNASREAIDLLNQGYESGAVSTAEYIRLQVLLRTPLADTDAILLSLQQDQERFNSSLERANDLSYLYYNTTTVTSEGLNWYAQRAQEAGERNAAFATSMERVQSATDTATQSLTVAGQAYSSISTSVWSTTQALQDQIDFLSAGGGALLELASTAKEALDEGNFKGAQEALDAAAVGAVDLDLELGKIDPDEAVERLMELGLGPEEATAKVKELQDSIFALVSQQYTVRFNLETSGGYIPGSGINAPGYTGGSGTKPSDAEGQSAGFGPAGGGQSPILVQFLGPVLVEGDGQFAAMAYEAAMRAQRQSAGVNAGSLYTGAA